MKPDVGSILRASTDTSRAEAAAVLEPELTDHPVGRRPRPGLRLASAIVAVALVALPVGGQERVPDEPTDSVRAIALDTVRVGGRQDNLIGIAVSAAQGRVGGEDLRIRPLSRETEVLETVPGLIVTQHSGEGKANQYFVRGFNLDHGTDFLTRVEGMPVNLPTHGHGQGYTDLNFIIPELVELLDYRLGVYHAELGDFSSAGGAEFHLSHGLDRAFFVAEVGEHRLGRVVAAGSSRIGPGELLLGGETKVYDGPWQLGQGIRKLNGMARYTAGGPRSRWSVLGLGYTNRWNASDQIPLRAVQSGLINRFGQVDDSNGGEAQRFSLSGTWRRIGSTAGQEVQAFGIYSNLDLFSNFTYFLGDPTAGDQFNQRDQRFVLGFNLKHLQDFDGLGARHAAVVGFQSRSDLIGELGLHRTQRRARLEPIREDRVTQLANGVFGEVESHWRPQVRTVLGARADAYRFDVESDLLANSGTRNAAIVSPKGSLIYTPSSALELYLSGGFGFHSNDARGTTVAIDPATGAAAERVDPLVRSRGGELGVRTALAQGHRTKLSLWALNLDSELLFVGDAGGTEPTDMSMRRGITLSNFYRPIPSLTLEADISLAHARLDAPAGEDRIPGALERVIAGGIAWSPAQGPFAALRLRHFGDYPLVEDNSVRADAATLLNGTLGYQLRPGLRLELLALNLLGAEASDIQYYYTSRLHGEPLGGTDDIHFHPVEPRQFRAGLSWQF